MKIIGQKKGGETNEKDKQIDKTETENLIRF